jgi:hypothetical protein
LDIKPQTALGGSVGLKVTGLDEVNDFDFIHMLWLYLLFHVICLGVAFHKPFQTGLIILWGYLHALTFGAWIFLHVSFKKSKNSFLIRLDQRERKHQEIFTLCYGRVEHYFDLLQILNKQN